MVVVKKGKELERIKRITPDTAARIMELIYFHEESNIPHVELSEMFHIPRATVIRWLNRYYVDRTGTLKLVLRGEMARKPKPDCPRKCYICGKSIPRPTANSSFCSRKCKSFHSLRKQIYKLPDYDTLEEQGKIPLFATMDEGIKWASVFLRDRANKGAPKPEANTAALTGGDK